VNARLEVIKRVQSPAELMAGRSATFLEVSSANVIDERHIHPIGLYSFPDSLVGGKCYVEYGGSLVVADEFMPTYWREMISRGTLATVNRDLPETKLDGLGLLFLTTGYDVYGHWLLDALPRLILAKTMLGDLWPSIDLVIPSDTPPACLRLLTELGIENDIRFFVRWKERVRVDRLIYPTLTHSDYVFHPLNHFLYELIAASTDAHSKPPGPDAFYVSRRHFREVSRSVKRVLANEDRVIDVIQDLGLPIIEPERLEWSDQIALFRDAHIVVGEFGSAMHTAIFARPPFVAICLGHLNKVQDRIAAFRRTSVEYVATRTMEAADGTQVSVDPEAVRAAVLAARDSASRAITGSS
jgi:capsular polysaccharide biosynthesis protein